MRLQLAPFALAVAALLGTTVIASAQMQPAPGASSDGKAAMDATKSNMKPGTTTGPRPGSTPTRAFFPTRPSRTAGTPAPATENNVILSPKGECIPFDETRAPTRGPFVVADRPTADQRIRR